MVDVEVLCWCVVVIYYGWLLFDGELIALVVCFLVVKTIVVRFDEGVFADLLLYGEELGRDGVVVMLRVDKVLVFEVIGCLLREHVVVDLMIEDPLIDDVVEHVFVGLVVL